MDPPISDKVKEYLSRKLSDIDRQTLLELSLRNHAMHG